MAFDRVVLIGGSGFIGSSLGELLLEGGCHVKVVCRRPRGPDRSGLSFERGEVADARRMMEVIEGAETVYHLATGGGETWADFERDFIQGTQNVADACLQHGVKRLIYTSSSAALYLGGRRPVTEKDGLDPRPSGRGPYSRAKIAAEKVLRDLHTAKGLPIVIVRPAVVVGKGGPFNHGALGLWSCDTCCIGWGRGENPLPFVLVEDVARALAAARTAPAIEGMAFNLAGDVYLSASEFVRMTASHSKRNFRFYPQNLFKLQALEISRWILKVIARKPDNPFPSFRDLKSRSLRAPIDCTAAKQFLGWQPNRDPKVFAREAIESYFRAIPAGDLRLVATG